MALQLPQPFSVHARAWIEAGSQMYLGYGRVVLLERIQEYGSISAAAKSMAMSYRHAWDLVDSMNRLADLPLVETARGGLGGGGARLTQAGLVAVRLFRSLDARLQEFRDEAARELLGLVSQTDAEARADSQ